jgi:hypothetical protein
MMTKGSAAMRNWRRSVSPLTSPPPRRRPGPETAAWPDPEQQDADREAAVATAQFAVVRQLLEGERGRHIATTPPMTIAAGQSTPSRFAAAATSRVVSAT